MSTRSQVLSEVAYWASHKRDGGTRGPDLVMHGRALEDWKAGYYAAMNQVAQHFNMERYEAEQEEARGGPIGL